MTPSGLKQRPKVCAGARVTATDLLLNRADLHHVYPRQHLKALNHSSSSDNQIAKHVIAQSEINIAIGAKPPATHFVEPSGQIEGGPKKYGGMGGITECEELLRNLRMNRMPERLPDGEIKDCEGFLEGRHTRPV